MMRVLFVLAVCAAVATAAKPHRLIQGLDPRDPEAVHALSDDDFFALRKETGRNYFDVSFTRDVSRAAEGPKYNATIPTSLHEHDMVNLFKTHIQEANLLNTIQSMSDLFFTRYYETELGKNASLWVAQQFEHFIRLRPDVSVTLFNHSFPQHSVIARIPGTGPNKDEIVIIGAHLDSINLDDRMTGRAPGADDDATGIAILLETFRMMCEFGVKPSRTIEFHGYAAEEGGLLGSQDVAAAYYKQGKVVAAMLQLDQNGFVSDPLNNVIGLYTDFVSPKLTALLGLIIKAYCGIPYVEGVAGYASSDMASWNKYGYPSSYAAEGTWKTGMDNKLKHHETDVIGTFEISKVKQLNIMALGFAIELAMYKDH